VSHLYFVFLLTLNRHNIRSQAIVILPWLALHSLVALWPLLHRGDISEGVTLHGIDETPHWHHVSSGIGSTALLTAIVSAGILAGLAALLVSKGWPVQDRTTRLLILGCSLAVPPMLFWGFSRWQLVGEAAHTTLFKHVVSILAFGVLTVADVRRTRPEIGVAECGRLFLECLPAFALLFPMVAIALGMLFLLLGSISDTLGCSHAWLNLPIYYGVVYAPWGTLYFMVKRASLAQKRSGILP